jgi:ADP-ribosyl-[dinitrogen reductase] hydrolase
MLLEIVAGDTYGMAFEYASPSFVCTHNSVEKYVQRGRRKSNRYGDDAQMSIATAEIIVNDLHWTKETCADRYVDVFKRDPRTGYASGFYGLLTSVQNGTELLEKISPISDKSGAAMRASLIGLYPEISKVISYAGKQATVTHNTPDGISAAIASALMFHYFAYGVGEKADLPGFLQTYVDGQFWSQPYIGAVGAKGWMSVRAAITAIVSNRTMKDILQASIAYTGDVDTVAAIAMGAASMSPDIEQNLPTFLFDDMERGPYGYDFIVELDARLQEKYQEFSAIDMITGF